MKVLDFLTEQTWCKGNAAEDANGCAVKISSPDAVRWCIAASLNVCYPRVNYKEFKTAKHKLYVAVTSLTKFRGYDFEMEFNDNPSTTWTDVRRVLLAAGI